MRPQATIDQGYIYAGARRSCLPTSCSGMDQVGWHGELSQLMLGLREFQKMFPPGRCSRERFLGDL